MGIAQCPASYWNPALIQSEIEWKERNRALEFFPDAGPYRRELYAPHMEFFAAGAKYRTRVFLAANRCITPWTPIEMANATRLAHEVFGERDFSVRSWDGGSRCSKPAHGVFLKCIEPAFRIHLDNGQFFDCSRKHRLLTAVGWLSLDQLIQLSSGLRCWREPRGFRASCDTGNHCDDQRLRRAQDSALERLPSLVDAPEHSRGALHGDAAEPRFLYSRVFRGLGHFANTDDPSLIAGLCEQFEDPGDRLAAVWSSGLRQELLRFALEYAQERAVRADDLRGLSSGRSSGSGFHASGRKNSGRLWLHSESLQYEWQDSLALSIEGFPGAALGDEIVVLTKHPALIGDQKINFIVPLSLQPIIDYTVPETHCYESGGVIHHNTGKTVAGAYEAALHLTGRYPGWWQGKRFDRPIRAVVASDTGKLTREVLQTELLGMPGHIGTGMIPYDAIAKTTMRSGVTDAIDTAYVRHAAGGYSTLIFKSYEQGRESFQGLNLEFVWADEEMPESVFDEALTRTATTNGIMALTFTPIQGLTPLIQRFLPDGQMANEALGGNAHVTQCTWSQVPHLPAEVQQELLAAYPAYQRDARSKGVPALGAGAVYQVAESDIVFPDFDIPDHWPRAFGVDVGWRTTAAIWCAKDRQTDTMYLYAEHYRGEAEPVIHAEAIKARGRWIAGAIDPAARGRSQVDGRNLLEMYVNLGLELTAAENAVESGIYQLLTRMTTGRLKVFRSLQNFLGEFRLYRRDEKGRIVKERDHLLDALRYVHSVFDQIAKPAPAKTKPVEREEYVTPGGYATGWMG